MGFFAMCTWIDESLPCFVDVSLRAFMHGGGCRRHGGLSVVLSQSWQVCAYVTARYYAKGASKLGTFKIAPLSDSDYQTDNSGREC